MSENETRRPLGIMRDVKEEMTRLTEMREGGFVPNRRAVDKYIMESLSELSTVMMDSRDDDGVVTGQYPITPSQFGLIARNIIRAYRKAMGDDK